MIKKEKEKHLNLSFYSFIFLFWIIRLIITSEQETNMVYGPHDGYLYVRRAYNLFVNGTFGDYDSLILLKNALISYILYAVRQLGISYHIFVESIVLIGSLYTYYILQRFITNRIYIALLITIITLFLPVTYDYFFFSIGRESISISISILFISSFIGVLYNIYHHINDRISYISFSISLLILVYIREEGILYLFFLFFIYLYQILAYNKFLFNKNLLFGFTKKAKFILFNLILIFSFAMLLNYSTYKMYGIFIQNDFSSGNFPKLINSLRSIKSENRAKYISIPRDVLEKVAYHIPEMKNMLLLYPAPPGKNSDYYNRYGVHNQWSDSHNLIWIKDAIWNSKVSKNAVELQKFYFDISQKIDNLCYENILDCDTKATGLIRKPNSIDDYLLWLNEFKNSILDPFRLGYYLLSKGDNVVHNDMLSIKTSLQIGKEFEYITMSNYDPFLDYLQRKKDIKKDKIDDLDIFKSNIKYWLDYPDVANCNCPVAIPDSLKNHLESIPDLDIEFLLKNSSFNKNSWKNNINLAVKLEFLLKNEYTARSIMQKLNINSSKLGAEIHYINNGKYEGRNWKLNKFKKNNYPHLIVHKSSLSFLKEYIEYIHYLIYLFPIMLIYIFIMLFKNYKSIYKPIYFAFISVLGFYLLYSLATSMIAVSMGGLDGRMYYTMNLFLILISIISTFIFIQEIKNEK